MTTSPEILDENNNSSIDLNHRAKPLLDFVQIREDDASSDAASEESELGKAYSVSTTSAPPDDPDRILDKADHDHSGDESDKVKLKKLEDELHTLRSQLKVLTLRPTAATSPGADSHTSNSSDEHSRPERERERSVVFKCIPQAHVANGLILTRVAEFFKIPQPDLKIQITDQLNKWCVVVLQTPSRLHASTILRKFPDFRKLYHCYHRTQALPCFSNDERQRYQTLWAEAIERNNREGYRRWEVDAPELKLVEAVGEPQKWRVKVHYFPDTDSPTASTSAIEVRRRQRNMQTSPKSENGKSVDDANNNNGTMANQNEMEVNENKRDGRAKGHREHGHREGQQQQRRQVRGNNNNNRMADKKNPRNQHQRNNRAHQGGRHGGNHNHHYDCECGNYNGYVNNPFVAAAAHGYPHFGQPSYYLPGAPYIPSFVPSHEHTAAASSGAPTTTTSTSANSIFVVTTDPLVSS
uniref:HTH La-type RNA-binding domain-containing protein n=1 Tax=Panagrellus redivivus TaxID=6233 RepID=A0A7E4V210_PANRE